MAIITCSSVELKDLKPEIIKRNSLEFRECLVVVDFSNIQFKDSMGTCLNCNQVICHLDNFDPNNQSKTKMNLFINTNLIKFGFQDDLFQFDEDVVECHPKIQRIPSSVEIEIEHNSDEDIIVTSSSLPIQVPFFGARREMVDEGFQPPHLLAQTYREQESRFGTRPVDRKPSVL